MESESSDGSTRLDPVVSKQQRVRDNQRRSRARRREYLAELENQLQQCHITCREVELQRTALAELQAENSRLRYLLKNAGISPDQVEISDRETTLQYSSGLTGASFRQLKPKLSIPELPNSPPAAIPNSVGAGSCSTPSPSSCCTPQPPMSTDSFASYDTQYSYQLMGPPTASVTTMSAATATNGFPTTSYDWYVPPHGQAAPPPSEPAFVCHVFLVPPSGPLCPDDGNSISCSVAKDMIAQYNPTPEEMDNIVARLSTAFSRPIFQGESCRINRHALFQILHEMNSNQGPPIATGQVIGPGPIAM